MNGNAAFSPYHAAHRLAEYNNHALSTVFNYCPVLLPMLAKLCQAAAVDAAAAAATRRVST